MNNEEFILEQQRAVERMKEMSAQSKFEQSSHKMPPVPPFVRVNRTGGYKRPERKSEQSPSKKEEINEPLNFLSSVLGGNGGSLNLKNDPDIFLLLGIILLISSESGDKLLLAALAFILL